MSATKRTSKVLAKLLPAGVLGISSALAAVQANAEVTTPARSQEAVGVADRLSAIRQAVSAANASAIRNPETGPKLMLAEWLNVGGFGWRNGGWHNGGWGNGGWGNGGWHNGGWGNGGWGNGGWHNWHNFWHNW